MSTTCSLVHRSSRRPGLMAVLLFMLMPLPGAAGRELPRAHSHNDYERPRPLVDALDLGFCSVEADIYLVGGELLVAHDLEKVSPDRTLRALYLEPLHSRFRRNGGHIQPGGCEFSLLIDFKSEAEPTWAALSSLLGKYRDMLTVFSNDAVRRGAVTVVISGNRAASRMLEQKERLAGLDGRLPDLELGLRPAAMPWISDKWDLYFKWKGEGEFPQDEKERLSSVVSKAHRLGYQIRFWAAPDTPAGWEVLRKAGVDLINTDDIAGLARFLQLLQ
jgi:hypothetical protein